MTSSKQLPLYVLPLLCLSWPVGALYAVEGDSNAWLDGVSLQQLESPGLGQMNQPVMIAKNEPVDVEAIEQVPLVEVDQIALDALGEAAAWADAPAAFNDSKPVAAMVDDAELSAPTARPDQSQIEALTMSTNNELVEVETVVQVSPATIDPSIIEPSIIDPTVMDKTVADTVNDTIALRDAPAALNDSESVAAIADNVAPATQAALSGQGSPDQMTIVDKNETHEVVAAVQAEDVATTDQATHAVNDVYVTGRDGVGEADSRWYGFNNNATLRAGPDVKFDAVAWATKDSRALELDRKGEWVRIQLQHNKRIGWIFESMLLPLNGLDPISTEMLPVESNVGLEPNVGLELNKLDQQKAVAQPLQAPAAMNAAVDNVEMTQQVAQSMDQPPIDQKSIDQKTIDIAVAKTPAVKTASQMSDVGQGFEQEALETVMIRAKANRLSEMLGWLGSGAVVDVLAQQGKWTKVRMQKSGRVGWVESVALKQPVAAKADHREIDKAVMQQAVSARSGSAQSGSAQSGLAQPESAQAEPAQSVSAKSISTASVQKQSADAVVQTNTAVYRFNRKSTLRAGPDLKYDAVAWAGNGSQASMLKRQGDWMRIQMQESKRIGWVFHNSLNPIQGVAQTTTEAVAKSTIEPVMKPTTVGQAATEQAVSTQPELVRSVSVQPESAQSKLARSISAQPVSAQPVSAQPVSAQSTSAPSELQQAGTVQGDADVYRFNRKSTLRAGPDLKYDAVSWAGNGSQASMLERQGDWLRIQMQESKRIGWVFHNSLSPIQGAVQTATEPAAKTIIEPVMQPQPVESMGQQLVDQKLVDQKPVDRKPIVQKPVDIAVAKAPAIKTANQQAGVMQGSEREVLQTVMIRAKASSLSEMLGWLGSGAVVDVLAQQGKWTKVRMQKSGRIGWVESAALQQPVATKVDHLVMDKAVREQTLSARPVPVQPVLTRPVSVKSASAKSISTTSVQKQSANAVVQTDTAVYRFNRKSTLRAGPDLKYDAVAWAGNGSQASMLERQGDWVRIQMQVSKRIGWVFHSSLNAVKGAVQLASELSTVHTTESATKSTVEPAMKPAVVNLASPTLQSVPNAIEGVDGQAIHQTYLFKRTSDMRSGPGKGYARIGWGGKNESAEEIGRQGDWTHVRMTISGKEGWVFNSYLERVADSASHDLVKPAFTSARLSDVQQIGSVYQVLRTEPLRSEAGDFAELIGSVSKGDMVTWLEVKNGWVKVSPQLLDSKPGWIQAKLLKQSDLRAVEHKKAIMNKANAVVYKDRISKGKTFNYSFAALDEALYRIPVEDIHIRMDKDDLRALFLKRQYDKSSFDVSIKTGRHKLHGRVKVLGSSTRIFKKKSLLLKLDKESARWYGHRKIALRSMASDKSLMREWMAWKMMAALGMKVPEVHFTRLSFNHGEKSGLYLSIEWMGPEFLEANGLDVRGEFYQPIDATHCGDLYTTDNLQTCFEKITPQNDDYTHLKRMATAVNAANNDDIDKVLESYFNVESVINWITVNALLTNGDTYNKNYWLYFYPAERRWTVVPWDYNLTFGRTYDQYGSRAFRIFNNNFQYYYPPDVGAGNPIKDKALRNPKLRAQMETKIKHLIGMQPNGSEQTFGWFSPTVMHARIGNLATVVGKELYKDTFLSYGEEDFTKTYESLMHYVTAHDYFLKTKLFGDFEWNPEPPNQGFVNIPLPGELLGSGEIKAGSESLHLIDRGWGYFVAQLDLDQALESNAEFEVKVEGGITPKYLPTGQSARRCIERSWLLHIKTPKVSTTANVMFEYAQENSRRSEVPPSIHEELLELWMLDGNHWKPVQTEVNEYSNTLLAKGIHIQSGHNYRFVACSPF